MGHLSKSNPNITWLKIYFETFGTQSFFILPPDGIFEQTHSTAPSSLPNEYFLSFTLKIKYMQNYMKPAIRSLIQYPLSQKKLKQLTAQSPLDDEPDHSPWACRCSPPLGPAWSRFWGSHKPPGLQYNISALQSLHTQYIYRDWKLNHFTYAVPPIKKTDQHFEITDQ